MDTETVEKVTVTETPTGNVTKQTVVRSGWSLNDFFVSKTNQVIFTIVGIIDLLILLRVVFLLLGANRVGIVNSILSFTQIFVSPFVGIFPSPAEGVNYLDVAGIVAIIMYIVFGAIIGVIIDLFSSRAE